MHIGNVVFGDQFGGDKIMGDQYNTMGPPPALDPAVILLMSANPVGSSPLQLDKERRAIGEATALAETTGRLTVRSADALRLRDLPGALLRHRPDVAHFSGHGTGSRGLLLLDDFDQRRAVPPTALAELFGALGDPPRVVVLNACLTRDQAQAIAARVPCVVGVDGRIADPAAICFATGFYLGIAGGRSVRDAFRLGRNRLELEGFPDAPRPVLAAAPGVAEQTFIVPPHR